MRFDQRRISVSALITCALLAGCGGGSHSSTLPQPAPVSSTAPAAPYSGPLADATFRITIPGPKAGTSKSRRPSYVSSATLSVKFFINSSTLISGATLTAYNARPQNQFDVGTLPNATCPASGSDFVCTVKIQLPPGTDNTTVTAYENTGGTGNILSQQIANFNVVAATANSFNIILDANAATLTVSATSGFCAGSFTVSNAQTVATVGTNSVTFNASYTDPATKTIVGPGLPVLAVNGHTNDNGGSGYSDPGNLNVKVNQTNQSYTLSITTGTGTASVAVTSTHPAGDGLTFSYSLNHSFQAGGTAPANFLAAIEQTGTNAGQIDLFTINTANDSFSTYAPSPTLAVQPAPVAGNAQNSDVDFPQDILFDTNGDLLIANGGGSVSGVDFGNFACVPAGAITTGANAATVLTNNMNDPEYIALGTDSSVALGNVPGSSLVHVPEFVLGSTYAAASTTRDIVQADYPGLGVQGIVPLPTSAQNPAGSYAVSITNGTTTSHIIIKHPDGSTQQIDDANLIDPVLGFDSATDQIVAANGNDNRSMPPHVYYLTFFSTTGSKVKQIVIQDTGCFGLEGPNAPYAGCPPNTATGHSNMKGSVVAASSSGYVAVGGITASGLPEVQVYDNTANRNPVGGPIPYDGTTTKGGAVFVYGSVPIVHALRWITGTKLLVSLESNAAGKQGLYIYDVSKPLASPCTCYDPNTNQFPNSPQQTGFQPITKIPSSVAYKP